MTEEFELVAKPVVEESINSELEIEVERAVVDSLRMLLVAVKIKELVVTDSVFEADVLDKPELEPETSSDSEAEPNKLSDDSETDADV